MVIPVLPRIASPIPIAHSPNCFVKLHIFPAKVRHFSRPAKLSGIILGLQNILEIN
jgi:hypothetical protein